MRKLGEANEPSTRREVPGGNSQNTGKASSTQLLLEFRSGGDAGADVVSGDHAFDVADFFEVEHDNRDVVFHAVMNGVGVHNL